MRNVNETYPIVAEGVFGKQVEDDLLLVVPRRGRVNVVNGTGKFVWAQINGQNSVANIAQALCKAYDITLERAQNDAVAFLESLVQHGAVRLLNHPAHLQKED